MNFYQEVAQSIHNVNNYISRTIHRLLSWTGLLVFITSVGRWIRDDIEPHVVALLLYTSLNNVFIEITKIFGDTLEGYFRVTVDLLSKFWSYLTILTFNISQPIVDFKYAQNFIVGTIIHFSLQYNEKKTEFKNAPVI